MKPLESYKQQEIGHYDRLAKDWQQSNDANKWDADAEYLAHGVFASYQFVDAWLGTHIKKGDSLLDYGCGNGIHSILPAKLGAKVTGIDLSSESLAIARERAKRENVNDLATFRVMDCERMDFADNTFDIVLDGGTFSSLNLAKAIPELARVLKPSGTLIAIETFGHNPLTNIKRKLNRLLGRRTNWAVGHILKTDDIELIKQHFTNAQVHYFHLLSLLAFPFLPLPGGKFLLKVFEKIDAPLLRIPLLQRYAFKVVITASKPNK